MFEPETQLASWIAISVVMLTASLLFYHMTNSKTLIIQPLVAAFLASSLIVFDVILTLVALVPYNLRTSEMLKDTVENDGAFNLEHEKAYRITYTIVISFLLFLQLIICYYIIRDSFMKHSKQHRGKSLFFA